MAGIYIRPRSQQDQFGTMAFMAPNYASGQLSNPMLVQNRIGGSSAPGSAVPPAGSPGTSIASLDPMKKPPGATGFFELNNGSVVPYTANADHINTSSPRGALRQNLTNRDTARGLDILSNPATQVDSVTRNELAQMFSNHTASTSDLFKTLSQAESGYGMFGVRKINEAQKNLMATYPGRNLVSPTSGKYA